MLASLTGEPEGFEAAAVAFGEYVAYAHGMIAARRAEPRDDLFSILVHAEVDGEGLSDDDIVFESLLLLIGGDETTRQVTAGGTGAAPAAPRAEAALVARSPRSCPAAVEEMLRWVSPIKSMARTTTREVELEGDAPARRRQGGAALRVGQLRRAPVRRAGAVRHRPEPERAPRVRLRSPRLPRRQPRPARAPDDVRLHAAAPPRPRAGHRRAADQVDHRHRAAARPLHADAPSGCPERVWIGEGER